VFGGAGFLAKWYVLQVALRSPDPQIILAIVLVLTTVVSAGYYLHVVMVMFMNQPSESAAAVEPPPSGGLTKTVLFATVALILIIGLAPDALLQQIERSRVATVSPSPGVTGIPVVRQGTRPPELTRPPR
jgi:NADH-quinone oxidoreductase subunit N